ncbi:MAG TPA: diacylglycerol kinase family protein [Fimbriimonas sp.]
MTVIRNPTSGRGSGQRSWPRIEALLEPHRREWEIEEATTTPGATTALAENAVKHGSDVVVACGGDGTLMQVASALVGTGVTFGMVPLGTGNDFCRTLGLGTDVDLAVSTLFEGEEQSVDVGRWDCEGRTGIFLNIAGSGFDAAVAERINAGYRFLRGTPAYLAAVFETLITFRGTRFRVCIDEETCDTDAMLCAVANAQSYGGGMRVAPDAEIDDGLFDVVVVERVGRVEFMRTLPKVFHGAHKTHPKVRIFRGCKVSIESDRPLLVLADGEKIGSTPVSFAMEPRALKILRPKRP